VNDVTVLRVSSRKLRNNSTRVRDINKGSAGMLKIQTAVKSSGKEMVKVLRNDRVVGAASLPFLNWLHKCVPEHQLSPEQIAMVTWYQENRAS
jgi:hypothetical protein